MNCKKNLMGRRDFLLRLGLCLGWPLATYATLWEPYFFSIKKETIHLNKPLNSPLRILHISDLHAFDCQPMAYIEQVFWAGIALLPDIICITGDFITKNIDSRKELSRVLTILSKYAPTYAVAGNHDGGDWARLNFGFDNLSQIQDITTSAGINFLHNQTSKLICRNNTVQLTGVGDLWTAHFLPEAAFLKASKQSDLSIVLSHNPDSKEKLINFSWDLMLCGHTHGGQFIVPFTGAAPFAPVKDKRYIHGLYDWHSRKINVSAGVGTAAYVRINCPAEITLLEIT